MKQDKSSSILYIYLIPVILVIGFLICSAVTYFYTTTTVDNNGKIINIRWAKDVSLDFSKYLSDDSGTLKIADEGLNFLEENRLWLQILDENGNEVQSYHKPSDVPDHYSPFDLLSVYQYGTEYGSAFVGKVENSAKTYILGFPLKISKVAIYVDTERYNSGKIPIVTTIVVTFFAVLLLGVVYSIVMSRNLNKIRQSLNEVALRSYHPVRSKHFLHEIYDGINKLNEDIHSADKLREQNEKARDEWMSNITHDLKTPLAPIKGYAELLSDPDNKVSGQKAAEYGAIIGKNAIYAEQLINDLKLTYQLKNSMLPIKKENQNICRFVKELVIDILNNPDFAGHTVEFDASSEDIHCEFDAHMLTRALSNIIINAIVHNEESVEIRVFVKIENGITIEVSDNGCGMSEEERQKLFERYYRGTNTKIRPEGTGLGMAIAKQIVDLHGGTITAKSQIHVGTTITIQLPLNN